MSQFSVPSSDIDETAQTATTLSLVGGPAANWQALATDDDTKYIQTITSNLASEGDVNVGYQVRVGLQGLDDPLIDAGWFLVIGYRFVITDVGPSCDLTAGHWLRTEWLTGTTVINTTIWDAFITIDGDWHYLIRDISGFAAGLRAGGFFTNPGITLAWLKFSEGHPGTCIAEVDWQFVQVELPNATVADIEIESDAGFEFGGSNYFEALSDAGLEFDFSPEIEFNTFPTDAGLEFDCSAELNLNAYVMDAGLEFSFTPQHIVLSADCSGIYTLIPGQHYDEILSRNTYDNETQDVKIPDPQGKTGYFGG